MPIGGERKLGFNVQVGVSGSGYCDMVVANDDARTAQAAGDLLNPALVDDDVFHWVQLAPGITRVHIRTKTTGTFSTITADPVVRIFGCIADPYRTDATANAFRRLDNRLYTNAGVTLTLATTNTLTDGTYDYGAEPNLSGYDALGCRWIGVLVATAAAYTGDVATEIQMFGTN